MSLKRFAEADMNETERLCNTPKKTLELPVMSERINGQANER